MHELSSLFFYAEASNDSLKDNELVATVDRTRFAATWACKVDTKSIRRALGVETKPCCDGAFFGFFRGGKPPNLVLVEFKGTDVARAIEQLAGAVALMRQVLGPLWKHRIFAVIVSDRAQNKDFNSEKRSFREVHGTPLIVQFAERGNAPADLTSVLLGNG